MGTQCTDVELEFHGLGRRQIVGNFDAGEISSEAKLILDRIGQMVQAYAVENGYEMVVESAGHTTRNLPLFVHLEGAVDITDDIIKQLNDEVPGDDESEGNGAFMKATFLGFCLLRSEDIFPTGAT